jgi:hypothetical protein
MDENRITKAGSVIDPCTVFPQASKPKAIL